MSIRSATTTGARRSILRVVRVALITVMVVPVAPAAAAAQMQKAASSYVRMARLDAIVGDPSALQAGVGLIVAATKEFGVGAAVGAGISSSGFSGRGDLFGRFSLDPYHGKRWEPYVGGGVTERLDTGGVGDRTYLLGFIGANGPRTGRIAPGVELGFGGGFRVGVTLQWD